ncbi:hypothetical protein [Bacillus methanolicus]|uniref:hypothetical protein n=1 Tax=Bacillus methanolicus TaxID=1471 RepID=UPI0023800951|nr:hypothetical protein [Bacillus methanolicus]
MLGNMVFIDVVMCKDVQVEAEVKLEVEAKFCGPRPVIPIGPDEIDCPPFPNFPQQCPTLFPEENCLCQGAADFSGTATITYIETLPTTDSTLTPTGQLDLTALICDQCTLAKSSLRVRFVDTPAPTPVGTPDDDLDQSFTFRATEFRQPVCTAVGTLIVSGEGIFTPDGGVEENATFSVTLINNTSLTLIITSPSATVTIPLTTVASDLDVEVGPCERIV